MLMKTNFLNLVAKMPQNTGGGDSQTKRATLALPLRYLCAMLLALFMGVGNVWGAIKPDLTDVVAADKTPNAPTAALDMSTQEFRTPDANGWIVFYNKGVVEGQSWWSSAVTNGGTTTWSVPTGASAPEAPFLGATSNTNKYTMNNTRCHSIRFTGAEKFSILVKGHASRATIVKLFSYTSTPDEALLLVDTKQSSNTATVQEILFSSLNTSIDYVAYIYGSVSDNVDFYEIAIKGPASSDPVAVTGITIAPSPASVKVGKTITLTPTITPSNATDKTVTWSIKSGDAYASVVTSTGVVTGLAEGTAVITATANDGSGVSQDVTVNVTASSCPSSGELFAITVTSSSTVRPPRATDSSTPGWLALDDYATISGSGEAKAGNKATGSDKGGISSTAVNLDGNDGVFWIALDCELEEGDVIEASVTGNTVYLTPDCSRASGISLATGTESKYTITGSDKLVGESNIYFWKGEGNAKIASLTITRPAPPTNYTVTIDPNGGSYASTPDGWTESAGVYTKEIASGTSFTAPEGLTNGTDDLSWKDGSDNDVTFPVSIKGDITFVAQWAPHEVSDDATLKSLTVNGDAVAGFDPATIVYNVELPFGTVAVPTVAGAANDASAKSVVVTPAASLPGSTIVVVTAEDNSTKTYTINFTVSASKDILLVFKTGSTACNSTASTASQILSNNAAVSTYINPITFTNVEGDGDNGAEGGSLNVGKKAGNMFTLTPKAGYAIKALSFYAKVQDATCEYSLDGGAWTTLTSTNTGGDDCYSDIFSAAEVHEFRLRSTGTSGVWIRNMKLSITTACTPIVVSWASEPAAEYELGKAATAIAAAANSGATITYASDATGVIEVATDGALTLKALGTANLSASAPAGDGSLYCDASGDQISKSVKTYYLVTFDPQNGEATSSTKYYAGDAAIALPSAPSWPGHTFQGWFDAASDGTQVTSAVTPEASRTIYAQWTLDCAGATINTQPVGANYLIGRTATALNCEATAGNGGVLTYTWYSCDDVLGTNPVVLAGAPTPSTAAAATFYYYCTVIEEGCATIATSDIVTVNVAPKDGVSIIKVATTGGSNKTVTGLYAGEGDVYLSDSKKMDGGKYIGFTLDGTTLQAGDRINVHTTTASTSGGSHIIFYDNMTDKNELYDTEEIGGVGNNIFTINAAMVGNATAYVYRSDADAVHKWNGYVDFIEVTRAINPILTAITINGEAGTIDESAKTVAVELQPGYDLAALTIVPTIVSNTAEASVVKTVESNGGAWVIGDNTYRLTDKDGDYTDYTITLSVGVLKHTVSFNTHGGSAIADVEVEDGQKLTAAPADPTKEDYIFQGWAETDGGSIVDVTTITISDDKEFHAVWAADGAIKLIEAGAINTTNFVTGGTLSSGTISVDEVDYKYITLAGTNGEIGSASNVTTDRFVMYHATTTKTKIQIHAYANGNARQVRLSGLVEGASTLGLQQTINVAKNDDELTEYFSFDSDKHRTFYITIPSSASDVYLLQVKVIESGEPLAAIGTAGTSFNFNKGRLFAPQSVATSFDGIDIKTYNKYAALSTEYAELSDGAISFYVPNDVCLSVASNANGTNKYYVTNEVTGTDNETTTANAEFNLTGGKTWYIRLADSSKRVRFTNIAFSQPTCPEAVLPSFVGAYCEGASIPTLDATATNDLTDYNVVYSWFAADAPETELANVATFTPTADGDYKVKVTVSKAGYLDAVVISDAITVAVTPAIAITMDNLSAHASDAVALTVNVTAGVPTAYAWYTCDDELGTNPVLIAAAEAASYNIPTPVVEQYYKVVVSGVCGGDVAAVAHVTLLPDYTRVDVTESTTWDWTKASEETTVNMPEVNVETLLANVPGIHNDANFNSQALLVTGQYAKRDGGSNIAFQGTTVRFYVTKPGKVTITARRASGSGSMDVSLNGTVVLDDLTSTKKTSKAIFVPAGWVTIEESDNNNQMRLYEIVYNATPDYTRTEMLGNGVLGTICLQNNVPAGAAIGATFYELDGKDANGKMVFAEVDELVAGVPYVFEAHGDRIDCFYGETHVDDPVNTGALKGTFTGITFAVGEADNIYFFRDHALWSAKETGVQILANRAWMDMSVSVPNHAPKPGKRYISMGVQGKNAATGMDELNASETPVKMLIDGQLFILRGEKMYNANGQLVK